MKKIKKLIPAVIVSSLVLACSVVSVGATDVGGTTLSEPVLINEAVVIDNNINTLELANGELIVPVNAEVSNGAVAPRINITNLKVDLTNEYQEIAYAQPWLDESVVVTLLELTGASSVDIKVEIIAGLGGGGSTTESTITSGGTYIFYVRSGHRYTVEVKATDDLSGGTATARFKVKD